MVYVYFGVLAIAFMTDVPTLLATFLGDLDMSNSSFGPISIPAQPDYPAISLNLPPFLCNA